MLCHFHPSLEAALSTAPLKCHPCKVLAKHQAQMRERMAASRSEDDPSSEDDAVLPPEQRRNPFHHKVPLGLGPGQEWKSSKKANFRFRYQMILALVGIRRNYSHPKFFSRIPMNTQVTSLTCFMPGSILLFDHFCPVLSPFPHQKALDDSIGYYSRDEAPA